MASSNFKIKPMDIPILWQEEHKVYAEKKDMIIAGVDEAGRGPLAGPLVVAAVILPQYFVLDGLNDSKKLTPKKREELAPQIVENALSFSIVEISEQVIDELNILGATHFGMRQALLQLDLTPTLAFIDGLPIKNPPIEQQNLVKGDSRSANIAAASILAKVRRDEIMLDLHEKYPQYNFKMHKGYPTKEHLELISLHGICPHHRLSYEPVRLQSQIFNP